MSKPISWLILGVSVSLLQACGGGGGADVVETPLPPPVDQGPITYNGPPPATADIQQFKLALWDNISGTDRCGDCHNAGGQSPTFARADDINLAYAEANGIVDLTQPEDSLMVSKVAGGHNCWQASDAACSDILSGWIRDWAGVVDTGTQIVLTAPTLKDPGSNKNFPDDHTLFSDNVLPVLQTYCASCHSNSAALPIAPYFASDNPDEAYQAAKSKIDLDTPSNSRFVVRLSSEFHNCWGSCNDNALTMQDAITNMADGIDVSGVDPALLSSKALNLVDGIPASGGGRFDANAIALWQFKTGSGTTAYDTSGVDPAINLTFNGEVDWIGGWGIQFANGRAQGTTADSKKLYDLISATGEFSVETWVAPGNVTQDGPAGIVSYSAGTSARNFTLGQTLYNYDFLLRHADTDANGEPAVSTPNAAEILQATLQHVVVNYDPINGRQTFVNGQLVAAGGDTDVGNLNDWDDSFALVLGNEVSGDRPWAGSMRMLAIHNRVLTPAQIQQNYDVGVGEKFYLLFNISDYIDLADSYVVFEASQFDNYGYLFSAPFYFSLDDQAAPDGIDLQGLRIGINGREANVGQVYANLSAELSEDGYSRESGQQLSPMGTVISVEKGPEQDEFFLTFERIGSHTNVYVEAEAAPLAPTPDLPAQSDIGVRTFADIHASMSAMTGVSMQLAAVNDAYQTLQQQLPRSANIESFLAANQMAIAQLGIKYCNELVEDQVLRTTFFGDFDFSRPATTAFDTAGRNSLIGALNNQILGTGLSSQPDDVDVATELNSLIDRLTQCADGVSCDVERTATIAKASCAATLSSAAMLLQ